MDNEPQSIMDLLQTPVESPSDAASEEGLQSTSDGIQDGQSDAVQDDLASHPEPAQTESEQAKDVESTGDGRTEAAAAPEAPKEEQAANQLPPEVQKELEEARQIKAAIQEARRQQEEAKQLGEFQKGLASIASGDIDEEDIPRVTEMVIKDISAYGAKQAEARLQPLLDTAQRERDDVHAVLTSVVAAIRSVAPDVESRILAEHQRLSKEARTSSEIERRYTLEQEVKAQQSAALTEANKKIEALTAQLAGKQLQGSNVYNAESQTSGGPVEEPTSIMDLLTNEKYGRAIVGSRSSA